MGKTVLKKFTKTITTSDGNAQTLFDSEELVYSVSIEMHQDSSVDDGWTSGSGVTLTSTNKNGQHFSKTAVANHQTRWRNGGGATSNLIDASSINVAADTGAKIVVSYMKFVTT